MTGNTELTFFHQQVLQFKKTVFNKEHLYEPAKQAKKFMDDHFAAPIDIDAIAAKAFLSKFHFIRLFKALYGITPYQYLSSVRIEKAKQLLRKGHNITDACFAVGFESVTSFSGLFKKSTGYSPAAFSKKHKK
ncbi:helix-turn-helix domain-containing protein [Ferruginibacter sp.]